MFGLLSDLDSNNWEDSADELPKNKKEWDGYARYNVSRHDAKGEFIKYFLTTNAGDPLQGLLYGAQRNPLKNVLHCYMNIVERKPGNIITGIAVEDDWVKMTPDYLSSFPVKTEADKEAEKQSQAEKQEVDIGIFSDLDKGKWERKGETPRMKGNLGYEFQEVLRTEVDGSGKNQYKIFLCSSTGHQSVAKLPHTLRDALHSVTKGYFKIENDIMIGMMIEEEWFEMKSC